MAKDNRIWKGTSSVNIFICAIVIFGFAFILQYKYNFNEFWIFLAIPVWLLIAFMIDEMFGLTNTMIKEREERSLEKTK